MTQFAIVKHIIQASIVIQASIELRSVQFTVHQLYIDCAFILYSICSVFVDIQTCTCDKILSTAQKRKKMFSYPPETQVEKGVIIYIYFPPNIYYNLEFLNVLFLFNFMPTEVNHRNNLL